MTVGKYVLVGVLLTVSIVALGWGVWSYTFHQNLEEPPVTETSSGPPLSDEEWNETLRAEYQGTTTPVSDEEWNESLYAEYEAATTSALVPNDDWEASHEIVN